MDGGPFEIDFRSVLDGPKLAKNRLHIDVKPVSRAQGAELDRLLALGARQVDVGQGIRSWYVLADPEGNKFCLCRPDPRPGVPSSVCRPQFATPGTAH